MLGEAAARTSFKKNLQERELRNIAAVARACYDNSAV